MCASLKSIHRHRVSQSSERVCVCVCVWFIFDSIKSARQVAAAAAHHSSLREQESVRRSKRTVVTGGNQPTVRAVQTIYTNAHTHRIVNYCNCSSSSRCIDTESKSRDSTLPECVQKETVKKSNSAGALLHCTRDCQQSVGGGGGCHRVLLMMMVAPTP